MFVAYNLILNTTLFNILLLDQLNTSVHGTVKTTPYDLVFGQPPRQSIFPGVKGENIMEEDVEDLFEEGGGSELGVDDEERFNEDTIPSGGTEKIGADELGVDGTEENGTHDCRRGGVKPTGDTVPIGSAEKNAAGELGVDAEEKLNGDTVQSGGAEKNGAGNCRCGEEKPAGDTVPSVGAEKNGKDNTENNSDKDTAVQLASTEKHRNLREEADKMYRDNAEKIQLKYCKGKRKKVMTFCPGSFVSVKIPRIDLQTITVY